MGRLRKSPENIQVFVKKHTNWKLFIQTVQKLAFGGFEYTNGNNVKCIAQPDAEMLKLLLYVAYGRPTEMEKDETAKAERIWKFTEFLKKQNVATLSAGMAMDMDEPNDDVTNKQQ